MNIEVDSNGWTLFIVTYNDGVPHRRPLQPGTFVGQQWYPADLTVEAPEVRSKCAELWTPAVIAAYQSAFPPEIS